MRFHFKNISTEEVFERCIHWIWTSLGLVWCIIQGFLLKSLLFKFYFVLSAEINGACNLSCKHVFSF